MKAKNSALILLSALFLSSALFGCQKDVSIAASSTDTAITDALSQPESKPEPEPISTIESEPAPVLPSYDYTKDAPAHEAVEDRYFSDAVFIGDSRTEGMFLYGSLQDATFLCGKGATVSNVATKTNITIDGADMTIMDALAQTECSKIYISLGLNELGWADTSVYKTSYGELIDSIRALHPDAIIYLQDLIPVNMEVCAKRGQSEYVNNERIALYNSMLYELAVEKQVILLKVSAAMVDESGELPAEATSDGIHLNASFYAQWCDYLRTHTVEPTDYSPAAGQAPVEPTEKQGTASIAPANKPNASAAVANGET